MTGPGIRSVFPDKPEVIDRRITVEALQGQQQLTGLKDTAFPAAGISLFLRARADGAVLLAAHLGAGAGTPQRGYRREVLPESLVPGEYPDAFSLQVGIAPKVKAVQLAGEDLYRLKERAPGRDAVLTVETASGGVASLTGH